MSSKKNRVKDPLDLIGAEIDSVMLGARQQVTILHKARNVGLTVGAMTQEDVVEHMFIDTPSQGIAKLADVRTAAYSNQITFTITIANLVQLQDSLEYLDALERALGYEFTVSHNIESDGHRSVQMFITDTPYGDMEHPAISVMVNLYPLADDFDGELPEGVERCRRVLVGMDVHTHTTQTPKYKIVCS